jgi:hypothetical protein
MILTKKIKTRISHLNIEYYKKLGYDVKCNQDIIIPILDLPKESNKRIIVCCDVCNIEKEISYQKYNKNISSHNIYTCSNICSVEKIKKTNEERYGIRDYVNTDMLKITIKNKYDKITEEIERCGEIECIKCLIEYDIDIFIKNKNGRYKKICKYCRTIINSDNRRKRVFKNPELESEKSKSNRRKNIHIYTWRGLLKGYLQRKNIKKDDSTFNLLRYEPKNLKKHLESLFLDDMNWDNYGSYWQIDHIIPVSLFINNTPTYIANSLENLRPLYTKINISRKNKLDEVGLLLIDNYKTYIKEEYIIKYKINK